MPDLVERSIIQSHYETFTVCESIYANPNELTVDTDTRQIINALQEYFESTPTPDHEECLQNSTLGKSLIRSRALRLVIQQLIDDQPDLALRIAVELPLLQFEEEHQGGLVKLGIQSPDFLSRASSDRLVKELVLAMDDARANGLATAEEDNVGLIMDACQRVVTLGSELVQQEKHHQQQQARTLRGEKEVGTDNEEEELQRVWFWFPSLSTREKRRDLVTYASRWGLTGFVLAGTFAFAFPFHPPSLTHIDSLSLMF